ncbi:hypothetical protein ACPW96_16850 [Micromonospora sp. DT81.3]|uniref:hypothetical protein n=1 Tax=Micromonospora sp. DT81.3 TaxID=3416523 RepID=UPI003CEFC15A
MSAGTFEVVITGAVNEVFVGVFDGFTVDTTSRGVTRLVGWVPEAAGLHGALEMLRDFGIEVVSVTRISAPHDVLVRPTTRRNRYKQSIPVWNPIPSPNGAARHARRYVVALFG